MMGALDDGGLDVATHHPREGNVPEGGVHRVLGADDQLRFPPDGRQLQQHPKGDDHGKAQSHKGVSQSSTKAHDALSAALGQLRCEAGSASLHIAYHLLHRVVFKINAILIVQRHEPIGNPLHVAGHALHQVEELAVEAEHWREQQKPHQGQHHEHQHIGQGGTHNTADATLFQPRHHAPQAEHDDGGPDDDGSRQGQHVQQKHHRSRQQDGPHHRPHVQEAVPGPLHLVLQPLPLVGAGGNRAAGAIKLVGGGCIIEGAAFGNGGRSRRALGIRRGTRLRGGGRCRAFTCVGTLAHDGILVRTAYLSVTVGGMTV